MSSLRTYSAFAGHSLVGFGDIQTTLAAAKRYLDQHDAAALLVFEDGTGMQIDFDWRGSVEDVLGRLGEHPIFSAAAADDKTRMGPGRPKLGVICREVSLLPRHWEWLEAQSGGISVALRRLVDEARKAHPEQEEARRARDATGKVMWAIAGNLPGFEEASRALFALDRAQFQRCIRDWPEDFRAHLMRLSEAAFGAADIVAD